MRSHVLVMGRDAEVGARRSTPIERTKDTRFNWNGPLYSIASLSRAERAVLLFIFTQNRLKPNKKSDSKITENIWILIRFFFVSAVQNNSNANGYILEPSLVSKLNMSNFYTSCIYDVCNSDTQGINIHIHIYIAAAARVIKL